MDKSMLEKLSNFEKLWQRVSAAQEEKCQKDQSPLKLMPKKGKSRGYNRYTPYIR